VILHVASLAGLDGDADQLAYSAAQGATLGWTRALAAQLRPRGIRVNCVVTGTAAADASHASPPADETGSRSEAIPLQPENIAPACVFFASTADSGAVTGEIFTVRGTAHRAGQPNA